MFWKLIAFIVSRKRIGRALVYRAFDTPYFNLPGYMDRWWLFNGYSSDRRLGLRERNECKRFRRLPSIRIHHIMREDYDRAHHDHPWNARTIILKGWYIETRLVDGKEVQFVRRAGDTVPLRFGEYHTINRVSQGGVWTLFIVFRYQGIWGFLVDGKKVPHNEYLKEA